MIGKEILMTSVRRCIGSSCCKSDMTTNFRWAEMHFELLLVDFFSPSVMYVSIDNFALGTTKSPQKPSDFRWPEMHSECL